MCRTGYHRGPNVIMDHHQLGSIPLNIDLCLFAFIPGTVGKIDYN